jgi:glutaredoxin-related protein
MTHAIDQKLVVISLFGTANAYCGQQNLSEALNCVRQALTIIESIDSRNELHIATNWPYLPK